MSSYSIGEAKTNLSKLIAEAERGVPVEIRRGKTPVAKLVPVPPATVPLRKPGALKGKVYIPDDFDELPNDVARALGMID
jgi:prevent-host-death family protein